MALTNTITSKMLKPFMSFDTDRTPQRVEYLQTSTSGTTMGALKVFSAATATDDFALVSLAISLTAPTTGAIATVYAGTDQIFVFPTCTGDVTQSECLNFGSAGLVCGTTTTSTVSIVTTIATTTVLFCAVGMRTIS